jgi:hypothetical protein
MGAMGQPQQLRKLHRMHAEVFDPSARDWRYLGSVLLPNHAARTEVTHALKVFGLEVPAGGRVSWGFMTMPGSAAEGPRYLPKASVYDARSTMVVRLSPHIRLPIGPHGEGARPVR